jgi:CRISPR/Cas system-associated exonuclease Cas4 (RecB family)
MLIEKLDKYMIARAIKEDEEYKKTALSPTDALQCPRKVYYRWHKFKGGEPDARTCRVFSLGDSIHERWQKILEDMKIQLKSEYYIDTEYKGVPIHGYIDSVCIIDKNTYIVELKSQKDWMYGKKDYLLTAKEEHIGQVQMYMHFTGIHKAIIMYENKNDSTLKEFHIDYDKELSIKILEDFVKLYSQINLNELPDRIKDAKIKTFPCSYCEFKEICFSSEDDLLLEDSDENL